MLFSFQLGGTDAGRLSDLEDALRPLVFGLRRAGHRVISMGQAVAAPPALNVVVEHEGAEVARRVAEVSSAAARFGIFCAEDLHAVATEPVRRAALRDASARAEFIWMAGASEALANLSPAARSAQIAYGYEPVMAARRLVPDTASRDAGLVIYGPRTPYRMELVGRLKAAGLTPFFVEPSQFPDYIAGDLLSRAAAVLVTRDLEAADAPPAPRIAKAIANGALVVAEAPAAGPLPLAAYVERSRPEDMPATCRALLAQPDLAARGLATLERFRSQTSMAAGLTAALKLLPG